ncbi:MAG: SNF2-related protein [Acidobacteriota bacterium]|nr:SNF2-related protein [Acidobacteriota bacterium]
MWKPGDRLTHRFNPDLGPGVVAAVDGRTLVVEFPGPGTSLRLAADSDAIVPLELGAGSAARLAPGDELVTIAEVDGDGTCLLEDGRRVSTGSLWPAPSSESPIHRLARGEIDPLDNFALRLDVLHLTRMRQARGLGSFLGGRIELFPHQLYAAERATAADTVRWLLADEVGLGKTVEACLIAAHLLRTGRAERTLVVAPETLTVQWLGELWRKYHQVFVLLDDKRRQDIAKELGPEFNPFEAHHQMVISLERLASERRLAEQAAEAGIDLLIVDEAHHLRRPHGHPGNPAYRAIEPVAAQGRHVLLLTATPLEDDAHGFLRLVELLRPDAFRGDAPLEQRLERGEPLPPCTSATRRDDLGGLPPRVPHPIDPAEEAWAERSELERALRAVPAGNEVARRRKAERIARALASGAALDGLLGPGDKDLRARGRRCDETDPRIDWLAREGQAWRANGDKTLVFVAHRATLELLRRELSRRAQLRTGMFHEDLSAAQRDIEVAQFRLDSGPSLLVSTECGGEGRNFQFCHRLVLFDLPWNPVAVEQRIGRLDRIGRRMPVAIVYFRPPSGVGAAVARLYEQIRIFEKPLGGLDRELADVRRAIEEVAVSEEEAISPSAFDDVLSEALDAERRVQAAAYHELHREPYRREMEEEILARVPEELDELTEDVVLAACERLGLVTEPLRDGRFWSIELGRAALVESLPFVPGGSSYVGTFRRELAVENESDDFYASGHPLVEGLLAELESSPSGRVALLHVSAEKDEKGLGLAAIYADGPRFDVVCVDMDGRPRPGWAERLRERPLRSKRVRAAEWTSQPGWEKAIRRLASHLVHEDPPVAVALIRVG